MQKDIFPLSVKRIAISPLIFSFAIPVRFVLVFSEWFVPIVSIQTKLSSQVMIGCSPKQTI
jgi:hypothetical protein